MLFAIMPSKTTFVNKSSLLCGTQALLISAAFHFTWGVVPLLPVPNEIQVSILGLCGLSLIVLMPVAGWLGDTWIGRYRVIISGSLLSTVALWTILIAFIVLQFNWTPIPALVVLCIAIPVSMVGTGSIMISMLPFAIDQMIGASSEAFSAAILWSWWGYSVATLTQELLLCLPVVISTPQLTGIQAATMLATVTLCLSLILITDCLYHQKLEVHFKPCSPFKTAFRVLNYARKTKYPERRSAFTYIDEEEPSRLDYGKHKFGGPFTEEEVENVKTILRMLVFFVMALIGSLFSDGTGSLFHAHIIPSTVDTRSCVENSVNIVTHLTAVILIPVYRFILFPLLENKFRTYLKRVGAGLLLTFISSLLYLTLDTIEHTHSNSTQCMFDINSVPASTPVISPYWLLIPDILIGVGCLLMNSTGLEFAMAQIPISLRGTALGAIFAIVTIGQSLRSGVTILLSHFNLNKVTPSCGFYYYLVLTILIVLFLVLFFVVVKCYKLRERNRVINIHAIAEEHYERYLDQEEQFLHDNPQYRDTLSSESSSDDTSCSD